MPGCQPWHDVAKLCTRLGPGAIRRVTREYKDRDRAADGSKDKPRSRVLTGASNQRGTHKDTHTPPMANSGYCAETKPTVANPSIARIVL